MYLKCKIKSKREEEEEVEVQLKDNKKYIRVKKSGSTKSFDINQ